MKKYLLACSALILVACSDSDDKEWSMPSSVFEVTLTNVTAGQPLSPPLIMVHGAGEKLWAIGEASTSGLELLAEAGDSSQLMLPNTYVSETAMAPIMPGSSWVIELSVEQYESLAISVASMLVNTNDAFTGVTDRSLTDLAVGERLQWLAPIYDAGTEYNSELMADIPGPVAGGQGFDSIRDDVDVVAYHPGVVTQADGLNESILEAGHKFDQGAVTIEVVRRQ